MLSNCPGSLTFFSDRFLYYRFLQIIHISKIYTRQIIRISKQSQFRHENILYLTPKWQTFLYFISQLTLKNKKKTFHDLPSIYNSIYNHKFRSIQSTPAMITPNTIEKQNISPDASDITNKFKNQNKITQNAHEGGMIGENEQKENDGPVSFRGMGRSQKFIKKACNKEEAVSCKAKAVSKKKIVIVQNKQVVQNISKESPKLLAKISSSAQLSTKCLERAPSLKKIRRTPSCDGNNFESDKPQDSAANFFNNKKVKFQEIKCDQVEECKDQTMIMGNQGEQMFNFAEYYQRIVLVGEEKNNKEPQQSFMHFICSIFSGRMRRQNTKIQKRLMKLNQIKITGTKQEFLMVKTLVLKLLHEQMDFQSQNQTQIVTQKAKQIWKKLGFTSQTPLTQLKNVDILTILQWLSFATSHNEIAIKFTNLCIEFDFPSYKFYQEASKMYCQQIKKCKLKAKQWNEYQDYYKAFILKVIKQIELKSKQNIQNMDKTMISTIQKLAKNLNQARKSTKKPKKGSIKK